MNKIYNQSAADVLKEQGVGPEGLTTDEAKKRLE